MKKGIKTYAGIFGFFLTAAILLTAFYVGEMFPFGWGTLSWCDMNQQVIPLFCDLKDILNGEKSLFLNFSNAGGMNFYGVFFFFLSSPFSFSVALIEKVDIPFLMNILVVLKLCIASFTASFAFKKLSKNTNIITAGALGSVYSLCGYAMLFYQNIMWLDIMYLFPIIVLGINMLIEENRPILLTVSLTVAVILNFYISFMIFLFVIIFFGIFALVYKNTDRKIYINLGLSGIISLLTSSFVWLPCLLQYFSSARGNGFFSDLKNSEFFSPYETTLSVLLCSGIIFVGILFAVPKILSKNRETILLSAVFFATAIPLVVEPFNLMWHTGNYMSFPARYGFIPVFIGLLITSRTFPTEKVKNKNFSIPVCIFIIALSLFALVFTEKNLEMLSVYTRTLWGDTDSLKGQILICSIFSICYFIVYFTLKKRNLSRKIASIFLCLIVFAEGICSTEIFILSAKDKFSIYNYQSVISLKDKSSKNDFYRVNTAEKITDANMTGAAGFNSISHYTSLNDKTFMETAKQLGYSGYWMETGNWGGSILSDCLLSVGYTVKKVDREYVMEENPYYLGLGIKAEGEITAKLSEGNRLFTLGKAFSEMSLCKNPVTMYDIAETSNCSVTLTDEGYNVNSGSFVGTINYRLKIIGSQTLYFDCYNGFSNRLKEPVNDSFAVYVNNEILSEKYPTQNSNGLLYLGSFTDTVVNITIKVLQSVQCSSFGVFGIDENLLANYINKAETLNLEVTKGKVSGNATEGTYFLSLPYKDNYKITLNGESINYSKALSGFIAIDIPTEGMLEISFIPKGFYIGIVISVIGAALTVLFLFLAKRKKTFSSVFKNITYGVFLGIFGTVILSVYIIPIIVNLSDFKI